MTLPIKSPGAAKAESTEPGMAGRRTDNSEGRTESGGLRWMRGVGRFVWPVVCLFQLGLVAGLYFAKGAHSSSARPGIRSLTSEVSQTGLDHQAPDNADGISPSRSVTDCTQADDYLKRGWYEHALTRYESLSAGHGAEMPSSTRFKIAMCLDGLGQRDRAIAELGELAERVDEEQISLAAKVARARLWYRMRNVEESKRAVCELLLRSTSQFPAGTVDVAELSQLLGLILAMDALGTEAPSPNNESTLVFPSVEWRPESQCIWTDPATDESSKKLTNEAKEPGSLDVWPTGPALQDCNVCLTAKRGAVSDLVQQVADSANVACVWTDAARKVAEQRALEISTGWLPWPALVACLTEPLGLAWEIRDEKLHLSAYEEIGEEDRAERRAGIATSILSATARDAQRHPEAAIAYLGLGNLAFAEGQLEAAASWFERYIKEFPRSKECVYAYFNLGVVRRTMGDLPASRAAFFHAVDTSPAHPLVPLAHLFVGRIHLDEYDPEGAVAPLRRAVSMTAGADIRSAALIDLATALVLVENWRTANALLVEHHAVLSQPRYHNSAAFLGAYARYRTLAERKKDYREGQNLITALMGIKSESALPACGILLVGRAYGVLGLSEQMAETFEQALQADLPEPIEQEIRLELAEFALASGKSDAARKHFAAVLKSVDPAKARRARMRIAEIALAEKKADDCLAICRKLLVDAQKPEIPVILRLMGNAFEQDGDHQKAAQCFAGQCPQQ